MITAVRRALADITRSRSARSIPIRHGTVASFQLKKKLAAFLNQRRPQTEISAQRGGLRTVVALFVKQIRTKMIVPPRMRPHTIRGHLGAAA